MQKVLLYTIFFVISSAPYSKCWTVPRNFITNGNLLRSHICEDFDPGEPLLLTPLIKANKLEEARDASAVSHKDFQDVKSYSGFITVNDKYNSNLFFWFFPAEETSNDSPVLMWLQGGPGTSSLHGLFTEHGPFQVLEPDKLTLREHSWSKTHSMLYIDNPVGTGFSYTDDDGLATEETQIGEQLYEFIQQFFTLFPEYGSNELFIAGESYAGKYVPAIGYTILKNNQKSESKINLQGLAIGNGLSDPVHQYQYSEYLYQLGLVDEKLKTEMKVIEEDMLNAIQNEKWAEAGEYEFEGVRKYIEQSGLNNIYNYISDGPEEAYYAEYVQRNDIRFAIHVGNLSFEEQNVSDYLACDIAKSVAPWIEELLSNYRLMVYTGQVDIVVPYPLVVNYLQHLNFSSAAEYKTAPRRIWRVDGHLAGYVKEAGNLTEVLVRKAGHMVPTDQPQWAYDLIYKFVRKIPLY